jgi:hypothetical protein
MADPDLACLIWFVADRLRGDDEQSGYGRVILGPRPAARSLDEHGTITDSRITSVTPAITRLPERRAAPIFSTVSGQIDERGPGCVTHSGAVAFHSPLNLLFRRMLENTQYSE